MSKGSPAAAQPVAAQSAAAAFPAAHEAVTRPISMPNQTGRRSRHPLRHALAWACQLTIFAAYVTGVYLAVAVGLGALTPWSADWRTALRLAAVALTAAGFSTLRRNVSMTVDRLVLPGPSRYEALTSLAGRLRAAGRLEEALPSLARLLGEGTGARQAAVWLRSGPVFVRAAVWPMSPAPLGHHSFTQLAELGRRDDVDVFAPVRDGGEVLGVLSVALPAGRDPAPPDIRLVTDLANSAGSLLRNTLLTAELSQRLRTVSQQAEELHRSRRRLVAARDIARRRLVQELAVSVQSTLDGTRTVIGALETQVLDAAGDTEALRQEIGHACALISAARAETEVLIARFRSVVHGIYPPALSDYGLVTAVENLAATLPRTTRIPVRGLRRYPMEVESTAYFCAAVALRALAARDHAVPLRIRFADTGRVLVLTIIDESRSGEMGDGDRGLLDELDDHAGARGGTADAAEIGGSLWLQATIPLQVPPEINPAHNPAPDYPTESGHPAEAGSRAAVTRQETIRRSPASTAPGRIQDHSGRRPHSGRRALGGRRPHADSVFWAGFAVYSALSAAWLALGFAIGIVANVQAVRHAVDRLAHSGHPPWLADVAAGLMAGRPTSYPTGEMALDYAFSAINIAIAAALLGLARRDWTARLLAVGMVGSAAGFNLQAQSDIAAVQRMAGIGIGWWHSLLLFGVGGAAYVVAVLLFATGRLNDGGRLRWTGGAGLTGPRRRYADTASAEAPSAEAASAEARQQPAVLLRALLFAGGAAVLLSAGGLLIRVAQVPGFTVEPRALVFWIFRAVLAVIPVALMVGMLRFRLWDVERVFNRALVSGLLVLLIGVLYVGLVIGADVLLGLPMRQNPLIQIAATAAVVLALAPARAMLSRLADRFAYGQRPAPAQVLARLSALSQATLSGVAALPSLARIVGDGLGARSCQVRLARPDGRLEIGSWHAAGAGPPAPGAAAPGAPAPGGRAVLRPSTALVSVPVVHRGVTVGDIRIEPPAGGLAPIQRRLLGDLADGVSLVMRNARLAFELERRLAVISEQASAISASRWRIAAAQAQERRALERNLHDGAQPHLVAVRMSLGLAAHRLSAGPAISGAADLAAVLQGIAARIDDASTSLAQVAGGLYPPKLMEEGLCAALQAYVAAMPGEIALEFGDGTERARFGVEVEAAVCFACLEALQNARKHAPDAQIRLALERSAGGLRFTVVDTGPGIDPEKARGFGLQSMDDRVAAVGGTLEFRSQPGATTVSGWVPAEQLNESAVSLTAA